MSLFNPQDAEDQMAWIPIIGCAVPFMIVAAVIIWAVLR